MTVEVIGKERIEYTSKKTGDPVKLEKFYVAFADSRVEGQKTTEVVWNIMKDGKAPDYKVGEEIEVQYNQYGSLGIIV